MYVIQDPAYELLMLNKHGVIKLEKIKDSKFTNLYKIEKIKEEIIIDYEVVCMTCENNLKIYDPKTKEIRKPTNQELKEFIIR